MTRRYCSMPSSSNHRRCRSRAVVRTLGGLAAIVLVGSRCADAQVHAKMIVYRAGVATHIDDVHYTDSVVAILREALARAQQLQLLVDASTIAAARSGDAIEVEFSREIVMSTGTAREIAVKRLLVPLAAPPGPERLGPRVTRLFWGRDGFASGPYSVQFSEERWQLLLRVLGRT